MFIFFIIYLDFERIYITYKIGQKDYKTYIDPFRLNFSQCIINTQFKNGDQIEKLIDGLVKGVIDLDNIPIIKVCIIDSNYFSFDNRRLFCYQEAIRRGANFKKVPVLFTRENDNIRWKMGGSKKMVKNNDWSRVHIVPYAKYGDYFDETRI